MSFHILHNGYLSELQVTDPTFCLISTFSVFTGSQMQNLSSWSSSPRSLDSPNLMFPSVFPVSVTGTHTPEI